MSHDSPNDLATAEFLYGIEAGHEVGNDWVPTRVIRFPVTKKTAKRIYYDAAQWGPRKQMRFVDRQAIERDGEFRRRSAGWWEPDITVYLQPPVLDEAGQPDLAELKSAMAAAHPDRGGSDEAFIAARERYEQARTAVNA